MRKYSGPLGCFSYDETQYRLGVDADGKQWLGYVGTEMDGSRISVPEGIVDGTGMFQDTEITSQPALPDSLRVADCMFAGCENLREGGPMPASLESADYMYSCCPALESVEDLPEGLKSAQGMFDGCGMLAEPPGIPEGLENAKYMFAGCSGLRSQPDIPVTVLEADGALPEPNLVGMDREDTDGGDTERNSVSMSDVFGSAESEARSNPSRTQDGPVDRMALLAGLDIAGLEEGSMQDDYVFDTDI